jgi:hypothetical protein
VARPLGSRVVDLPSCSVQGHEGSRVTLHGRYGSGTRRQRYRCHPAEGSEHNFAGVLARIVVNGEECASCENPVPAHRGPKVVRRYEFPVREAAAALVSVGQGLSYTQASDRARRRIGRPETGVIGAQLVANWVEVLAPVATAPHAEVAWPETIIVDSTTFMVSNRAMHTTSLGFNLLAVWGYPAGERRGRLWAIRAAHEAKTADWMALFQSLPGTPALIVCDLARAPASAARALWGSSEPHVKYCEWHLRRSAAELMRSHGITSFGSPEMTLLNQAFKSQQGWWAFKKMAAKYTHVDEWVHRHDAQITDQVTQRDKLPPHHASSAVDAALRRTREFMEPRAFCYRNAERTNRMLELVRLRINRADDADAYAATIRAYLDAGGRLTAQGTIRDPTGKQSLR